MYDLRRNHDDLWKFLIKEMFESFIRYFIPELVGLIDFGQVPEFGNVELPTLQVEKSPKGNLRADYVVKVAQKDGQKRSIIIHIEVQATRDVRFHERMYKSHYRLYDRHNHPIEAIAIFVTQDYPKGPYYFVVESFTARVLYEYRTYHVHSQNPEELLKSDNPFALAVLACIRSNIRNLKQRYAYKKALYHLLSERGYSKVEKECLYWFIFLLLRLPNKEENHLKASLQKANHMIRLSKYDWDYITEYLSFQSGMTIKELMELQRKKLVEKDETIEVQDQQLKKKDEKLEEKDQKLKEKDETIEVQDQQLKEKDEKLEVKDQKLKEKDETIEVQGQQLKEQELVLKQNILLFYQEPMLMSIEEIAKHVKRDIAYVQTVIDEFEDKKKD